MLSKYCACASRAASVPVRRSSVSASVLWDAVQGVSEDTEGGQQPKRGCGRPVTGCGVPGQQPGVCGLNAHLSVVYVRYDAEVADARDGHFLDLSGATHRALLCQHRDCGLPNPTARAHTA